MDRVKELRGAGGPAAGTGSGDSTLDTTTPPSDVSQAFMSANESNSKYFSLSDSTFDISPIKDVSLASTAAQRDDDLIPNLSPIPNKELDSFKIGKQIEAANILSGGVNIFEDNDNSFDGNELVIDDNAEIDDKVAEKDDQLKPEDIVNQPHTSAEGDIPNKTEVVLQIDGKNVAAIDIGNGLYLYRKDGLEELAAVQIIDDGQSQPTFKFLKVRENAEENLEVYEEIEIEIPKDMPKKEESGSLEKKSSQISVTENKLTAEDTSNKVPNQKLPTTTTNEGNTDLKEASDINVNGKMKFSESRKSPVVGSFTPMTYHSTPNKEGKPLTKTMVDLHLHPSRHSDTAKKTIEVHTDSNKQKCAESKSNTSLLASSSTKIQEITDTSDKNHNNKSSTNESYINDELISQKELKIPSKAINNCSTEIKLQISEDIDKNTAENQLIIDEDVESNEAGMLVIDEKQSTEQTKELNQEEEVMKNEANMPEKTNKSAKETPDIMTVSEKPLGLSEPNIKEKSTVVEKTKNTETLEDAKSDKCAKEIETSMKQEGDKLQRNLDIPKENCNQQLTNEAVPLHQSETDGPSSKVFESKVADTQSSKKEDVYRSLPSESPKENRIDKESKQNLLDDKVSEQKLELEKTSVTSTPLINENVDNTKKPDTPKQSSRDSMRTSNQIDLHKVENVLEKQPKSLNLKSPVSNKPTTDISKGNKVQVQSVQPSLLKAQDNQEKHDRAQQITTNMRITSEPNKNVENKDNKDTAVCKVTSEVKPINNNHNAVPFGKWTDVNRQEFLNKFKEHKAPVNTNTKQIKNSNDLNRRDILKKIDTQRQSHIATSKEKMGIKNETIFSNKVSPTKPETKMPVKKDIIELKPKLIETPKTELKEIHQKPVASSTVSSSTNVSSTAIKNNKKEQVETSCVATSSASQSDCTRREVNVNDLITKTIVDVLNKATSFPVIPGKTLSADEVKQADKKESVQENKEKCVTDVKDIKKGNEKIKIFDDIEIKMNELHGIPFVERPAHELPKAQKQHEPKTSSTLDLEKTLGKDNSDTVSTQKTEPVIDLDSEEEVIEHEPITGDLELNKNPPKIPRKETEKDYEGTEKETVITEKEFDKFARRNSVTYDNCVTVTVDTKDSCNTGQNRKQKETLTLASPKTELIHLERTSKLPFKHTMQTMNTYSRKSLINTSEPGDPNNKNYQSKIHVAYQSVLTAKMDQMINRPIERPITIIEDKPVKVVFLDSNADFIPNQLNVQGQELSPAKKHTEKDITSVSVFEPVPIENSSKVEENKQNDDVKIKTKHQRKQVLTPVEAPELEIIQPAYLVSEVSPKKKRKTEDSKYDKQYKNPIHKKSYLLGRSSTTEEKSIPDAPKTSSEAEKDIENSSAVNLSTATALDSLVKAAEMIENQESLKTNITSSADSPQNTPVKRGRGRPRKYPLPGTPVDNTTTPSPQKKPRLIDAKPVKEDILSDQDSSDGEIVKENWTMGKINENIVCPICSKLFRSENVVFKHVKHCTGVSPNRSDSDKRSPRRDRRSQESDIKSIDSRSDDMDIDSDEKLSETKKRTPRNRKSRDPEVKPTANKNSSEEKGKEEIPMEQKAENVSDKQKEVKKVNKSKIPIVNNLVCEFCGKTFRQLSYLVSHKLQHQKEEESKHEKEKVTNTINKLQVHSCEVCKKEFRKLHHLVQHRIIHNPNTIPRNLRKTSSEQTENKLSNKVDPNIKQSDDPSAAFRCEPCDKSFRKLHHLVEHRETHDGINRQKTTTTAAPIVDNPPLPPQCEVCKKTFRKLHHLIEHKEQHIETNSELSDDKSVKSALSTKDIIHECPLCYMVFPNEHSLNKHSGICQRKKRQSKIAKNLDENEAIKIDEDSLPEDDVMQEQRVKDQPEHAEQVSNEIHTRVENETHIESKEIDDITVMQTCTESANIRSEENMANKEIEPKGKTPLKEIEEHIKANSTKIIELQSLASQKEEKQNDKINYLKENATATGKTKSKEVEKDVKTSAARKNSIKDRVGPNVTKRRKTADTTTPTDKAIASEAKPKPALESSDDDEVRYMFNPDYKVTETEPVKEFMKVRANKRNSLQIERPNSKHLDKRRTSQQHPPKIPRLKPKPIETKPASQTIKTVPKIPNTEATSTDSDDSDVKYSFPKTIPTKPAKPLPESETKPVRKSLVEKKKALSSIAKRKSLGQLKKEKQQPVAQPIKKRTREVEHRCDCGQVFSSAALLSRHISLAHTPPRKRRRSPPPDLATKPSTKPTLNTPSKLSRKSTKTDPANRRSTKPEKNELQTANKRWQPTPAHKGVPIPEKMRKLIKKNTK